MKAIADFTAGALAKLAVTSDDDLPTRHARRTARSHLTLILGAVDSAFVHSLSVPDRDGNEVEL
jgi:hypothetical protein